MESYAVAAFVPSLTGRGRVMIIEGLNMEGTEAAGELMINPDRFADLLRCMGAQKSATVQPFEALLKLTAVAGAYANTRVIAYRYPIQER